MQTHPHIRIALVLAAAVAAACGQHTLRPAVVPVGEPLGIGGADTLKAHMHTGELYLFQEWRLDTVARRVNGIGRRFGVLRDGHAPFDENLSVAMDSVALFETNTHRSAFPLGTQGVVVMTTLGAYISGVCLVDPKTCFGSCPTFYIEGSDSNRVQAEGFSSSVARVLEERDVDALPRADLRGRRAVIHMKNEAWETHVVRSANLLAVTRPKEGRVFIGTDSLFYATSRPVGPTHCSSPDGACEYQLSALDGVERSSLADSNDLATREVVDLTFLNSDGRLGLVLSARNSLITTFLFYQSMAYAGSTMARLVAEFERRGREYAESHFGMAKLLGPIQVEMQVDNAWITVGTFGEHGPIAADTKILPLPQGSSDSVRIRLRMAKGHWRLDYAAIAEIRDTVSITRLAPVQVERGGKRDDDALRRLRDTSLVLVSMPGDDFRLSYDLPAEAESLELFLESEGWYYEWQRREWLAEEDARMAAMVVFDPAHALKVLAPAYKSREPYMEQMFWASRFNR